ncbi:MAG TPA: hypothetical protein GX522_01750 [Firmicutes bacterium]|nr:hypothetical protein [Bacillota bacterium]
MKHSKKISIWVLLLLLLLPLTLTITAEEVDSGDYFFDLKSVKVVDITGTSVNLVWEGYADDAVVKVFPVDKPEEEREVPLEFVNHVAQRLIVANLLPKTDYRITFTIDNRSVAKDFRTKALEITRGPYLGLVTTDSVVVAWGSTDPIEGTTLSVWPKDMPDNKVIHEFEPKRLGVGDFDYRVTIKDLKPFSRYCYQVNMAVGNSEVYEFITAPNNLEQDFVFNVYGDTQWKSTHLEVAKAMAKQDDVSFLLHCGDVVDQPNPARWHDFFSGGLEMIAKTPLYPIYGNHDLHNPEFRKYFSLPGDDYWYSFDYGSVHVIALDVMSSLQEGSPQYLWLLKDLENAKDMPWKIVFMHYPIYSKYAPLANEPRNELQKDLVPVFEKHGVNIVFSGHEHQYDHYLVNDVHYIITGGGGAAFIYPCPNEYDAPYHYVRIEVAKEKLVLKAIKTNDEIVEEFSIAK